MKNPLFLLGLLGVASFTACAQAATPALLAPVGPDTAATQSADGRLRVFSGYAPNTPGDEDTKPFQNSAYEIRTPDGRLVETVPNVYGTRVGDQPPFISLAAGSYRVTAWSPKQGLVTVPVTIAAGRVTTVRLTAQG